MLLIQWFLTQEKLLESERHRKQLTEELQNVKQVSLCGDGGVHEGGMHEPTQILKQWYFIISQNLLLQMEQEETVELLKMNIWSLSPLESCSVTQQM